MAHNTEDHVLTDYHPETTTDEVTRCIVCPLETSRRKTDYLRDCVDEWQDIARTAAEYLPSYPAYRWGGKDTQLYQIVPRQYPDRTISAAVAREAVYKASEAFASWHERGRPGNRPIGEFGDGDYLRVHNQQLQIEENNRGYGVKLSLVPYDPEWFHIDSVQYHENWLERVCDPEDSTRHGSAEVYLHDDGSAALHLTVISEVEVVVAEDVERWVGVDLGENVLYATACVGVNSGEIENVTVESGREYRHYRERLKEKRAELSRKGDLRGVRSCKGDIERYTDWVLHTASKEIVALAAERGACGIRLEDLTGYREDEPDPIHDWPYAELQENICYKAAAAGIPVRFIDPYGSSQICNRCGEWRGRDGDEFQCGACEYEVHADVNAAIRIGQGNPDAR